LASIIERVLGYVMILVAVVGFSFFYTNINKSQKASIVEMKKKIEDLNQTLIQANKDFAERKAQVEKINNQIENIQKEIREKFEKLLDKETNYTKFIEQVERTARAINVAILNSQYEPPTRVQGAPSAYLEFRFTLNVKGAYENIKRFLWELENSLGRFVKISKMAIKSPICDSKGETTLTMTLSTFFLP